MATETLLTQRADDQVWEAKLQALELIREMDEAIADGEITTEEWRRLVTRAHDILIALIGARELTSHINALQSSYESAFRGAVLNPTPFKRARFRAAGLEIVGVGQRDESEHPGGVSAGASQ